MNIAETIDNIMMDLQYQRINQFEALDLLTQVYHVSPTTWDADKVIAAMMHINAMRRLHS